MPEFENAAYAIGFITGFLLGMGAMLFTLAGAAVWRLATQPKEDDS